MTVAVLKGVDALTTVATLGTLRSGKPSHAMVLPGPVARLALQEPITSYGGWWAGISRLPLRVVAFDAHDNGVANVDVTLTGSWQAGTPPSACDLGLLNTVKGPRFYVPGEWHAFENTPQGSPCDPDADHAVARRAGDDDHARKG